MLIVHGKDEAEAVESSTTSSRHSRTRWTRPLDDFGTAIFQFGVECVEIVDPDVGVDAEALSARHVWRRVSARVNRYLADLGATASAAAWTALSRPSTFTKLELDGTMYFVLLTSVLLSTSSRRIISARSLK